MTETETMDPESTAHQFRHQPSMLFSAKCFLKIHSTFKRKYRSQTQKLTSFTGAFPEFFGIRGHLFLITVIKSSFPCPTFNPNPCPKSISWLPRQLNDQLPWEKCGSSRLGSEGNKFLPFQPLICSTSWLLDTFGKNLRHYPRSK